ncbi:MAG: TRAP transporter small permease [Candidatus Hodarchaeota archaeon]
MGTKAMGRFYSTIFKVFDVVAITVIALEIITITIDVFLRYIFNRPLAWLEEFAEFGLIWLTFVISLRLVEEDDHFHVDAIVKRITSKRIGKSLYFLRLVLMIFFFGVVGYYGINLCREIGASYAMNFPIPKAWIYIIIPIVSFFTLPILVKNVINNKKPKD